MKKSTLITTIAMIVVVVVALSTATYAWFTSATKATTSAQISVTSSSGWMLAGTSQKTFENGTDTVSFDYTQNIKLNLLNGLYSPDEALDSTVTVSAGSVEFENAKWFEATQTGIVLQSTATATEEAAYQVYGPNESKETPASYIKVTNSKSAATGLRLTISVWTDKTDDAQLAAVQNLCAYISYQYADGNNTVAKTANTAYHYGTYPQTSSNNQYSVARGDATASEAGANTAALAGNTTFTVGDLATTFTGEDTAKTGGRYYQYTLDFGSIPVNGDVYIAMYIWFDGWNVFSTANGADASVYLAFGDAQA